MGVLLRIGRLVTAFFRRPLGMRDLGALRDWLRTRARPPKRPDFAETRIYRRPDPLEGWQASDRAVEVNETPLDTLPDELRDELLRHRKSFRPEGPGLTSERRR